MAASQQEQVSANHVFISNDKLGEMLQSEGGSVRVVDTRRFIVEDMLEQRFGRVPQDSEAYLEARELASNQLDDSFNWVYFPYDAQVVSYAPMDIHKSIRNWRDRDLVTEDQQGTLYDKRIAAFGLSVGSNILDQLSQSGIGNAYLTADKDTLSPSNLNRLRATMADVGLLKTVIAGRKLSRIDPYIEQLQLPDGYVQDKTDKILQEFKPHIILDEVDDLVVKAMIRQIAARLRVPVVMVGDVDERSVIDIERYDLPEEHTEPFNGKIDSATYHRLLRREVGPEEIIPLLIQLNGAENISKQLYESALNPLLGGMPQRGSTVTQGAAAAEKIIRKILLGDEVSSQTLVIKEPI